MKKLTVIVTLLAVGLVGFGIDASAQDDEKGMFNEREPYRPVAVDRLKDEANHLNRMMTHVARALGTYHASRPIRQKYDHVRQEVAVISLQLRSKAIDPLRLRTEIQRMHKELHQIEEELHVPVQGQYQWR
jgi:hypothetical protein